MRLPLAARFPRFLSDTTVFHGTLSDLCIPNSRTYVWGCPQAEILDSVD